MKYIILLFAITIAVSCKNATDLKPSEGTWKATLELGKGNTLPFLLDYNPDNTLTIYNAKETIEVDEVTIKGDSINIQMPVYEGVFKGTFTNETISGSFIKSSLNRVVPFVMEYNRTQRFDYTKPPTNIISGNWETVFSPNNETDRYIAKGIFKQVGNKLTGTFRTTQEITDI